MVGCGLVLPLDVEPYGPGEGELTASKRLLERAVGLLGAQFADYVVADGLYAGTPFIELAESLGLAVVLALNDNIPEPYHAAQDPPRGIGMGSPIGEVSAQLDPAWRLALRAIRVASPPATFPRVGGGLCG